MYTETLKGNHILSFSYIEEKSNEKRSCKKKREGCSTSVLLQGPIQNSSLFLCAEIIQAEAARTVWMLMDRSFDAVGRNSRYGNHF